MAGAEIYGPTTQGDFLRELGVEARLAALQAAATSPAARAAAGRGVRRLIDPGDMGTLFQVIAAASPGLQPPAGFAAGHCRGRSGE